MIHGLPENKKYKVRIQCSTYNQSKYIEDALRGFSMQQTNFPFVCCVMDDASTDGEPEVLKRWIKNHCISGEVEVYEHTITNILMAPDKDNRNCIYAVHLLKYNTWGKPERVELLDYWRRFCEYEALCEGDDYWIDPLKLQKQVDFMENNIECSMCFHNAKIQNESSISFSYINIEDRYYNLCELFDNWIVPTASIMLRTTVHNHLINDTRIINGDINIILASAHSGKIYGMKDCMSVYRVHEDGVTLKRVREDNIALQKRYLLHYKCLYKNYSQVSYVMYLRKISDVYLSLAISYYRRDNYLIAVMYGVISVICNPINIFRRVLSKLKKYD